jgi:hypothetical protein
MPSGIGSGDARQQRAICRSRPCVKDEEDNSIERLPWSSPAGLQTPRGQGGPMAYSRIPIGQNGVFRPVDQHRASH